MSGFCFCDFESPTMYVQSEHVARKRHSCFECQGFIQSGEKYQRTKGVWDGSFDSFATCTACLEGPIAFVKKNCGCIEHGGIFVHLESVFAEYGFEHPGVRFRVGRWLVEARRRGEAARLEMRAA